MSKLHKKIFLIIILLIGVMAGGSTFFTAYVLNAHLTAENQSKAESITKCIVSFRPGIFINLNFADIQAAIDQFAGVKGVSYIMVAGNQGEVLAHTFGAQVPRCFLSKEGTPVFPPPPHVVGAQSGVSIREVGNFLDVSRPILGGKTGRVHVGVDLVEVRAATWAAVLKLLLFSLGVFIISILVAYWFMNGMSQPLVALTHYANKVAANDFPAALDIKGGGELGTLARAITAISGQLADHLEEIDNYTEAARESERSFLDLFNSVTDLVFTFDLGGRFLSANAAVTKSLGFGRDELIGEKISRFFYQDDRNAFEDELLRHVQEKGAVEGTGVFQSKSGKRVTIEYRSVLVQKEGAEAYVYGSGRDVSQRITVERSMQALEEQLIHAQKMESVGTLANGIAHDFNNVLQAITGYIQLLRRRDGKNVVNMEYYDQIDGASRRASDLVNRLLTFSRKMEPQLKPVDINRIVFHSVELLKRTIPKMIAIRTDLSSDLKPIQGESNQLEQVLMNLCSNARDAMPEGGDLRIKTSNAYLNEEFCASRLDLEAGDYVRLTISDTGRGMDETIQRHIFEPFFSTKGTEEGTGLGLFMVYGIVSSHKGFITCQSTPYEETHFDIYLPVANEKAESAPEDRPVESIDLKGSGNLLLVDDEAAVLDTCSQALAQHGYHVRTVESGEQALKVYGALGSEIDLVILDLGMPGMGGLRCLTELLKLDGGLKIIVASGYSTADYAEKSLEIGASCFISKPYRLLEMVTTVKEVLNS